MFQVVPMRLLGCSECCHEVTKALRLLECSEWLLRIC